MANPAMFTFLDLSPEVLVGRVPQVLVGDLPDWYHTLLLPAIFAEFFALEGVSPRDLCLALQRNEGINVTAPPDAIGVGFITPLMGWSWAVVLAHWTLEDLLALCLRQFRASSRLSYKLALPQLSADKSEVHWEFIDDVGAIVLGDPDDTECSAAKEIGQALKEGLRSHGFGLHKDSYAFEGYSLGHEISPSTYGVRAARTKFWEAVGATEELLSVRRATVATVNSLVSFWTWIMMVTRSALSFWQVVYSFMAKHADNEDELLLPEEVLEEFWACLVFSPFFFTTMDNSWSETVVMVDASLSGGAVCVTQATLEEIRSEAAHAESKGWAVTLEAAPSEVVGVIAPSDEPYDPVPAAVAVKTVRALHTFSGPRREKDFEYFLKVFAQEQGVLVVVESVDVFVDPRFDMHSDSFYGDLRRAAKAGAFSLHLSGPPCRTWSRARFRRPGPPVVRTREHPYGVPGLTGRLRAQVEGDTLLFLRSLELSQDVALAGGYFAIENPKDPGCAPFPSMFATEHADMLRTRFGAFDVCFDQCEFGLSFVKPTQLLTNLPLAKDILNGKFCTHGPRAHKVMEGITPEGEWVTKAQSRYPPDLCCALARCCAHHFEELAVDIEQASEETPASQEMLWVKKRAPTADACWDKLSRWSERFRCSWSRLEHNNICEMRTAVLALKHLVRSRASWDRRVLIFTDSLVTLGVLTKGRSSSWPLLRLAREACAYQLILGIRPYWRYIETSRNIADGPSRGYPVGHAPPAAQFRDKELTMALRARMRARRS